MERRSKRLRAAPEPNYSIDLDSDDVDQAAIPDVASKKAPRIKKSTTEVGIFKFKRTVKGKRGQLEEISQLPLDILFEIFLQLNPIDILNLSRVSKSLRNILMRRSSAYIWKDARTRIPGLPECPVDMSEPAYANLVFHPYCQFCLKVYVNSKSILWMLRTRACKKCFAEQFERLPWLCDLPVSVIPTCQLTPNNRRYPELFVNKHTFRQYLVEKEGLEGSALDEWCTKKRSEQVVRREHANRCDKWNKTRNVERSNELDNMRDQRYQAIRAKLSDLGWGEEIIHLENSAEIELSEHKLTEHKLVKQPKALTERIWSNIKDSLVEFMEKAKARRLDKLYRDTIKSRGRTLFRVLETYASSQPLHAIIPSVGDVAVQSAFRAIIEDTPVEQEVLELHFQHLMVDFPQFVTEWRQSKAEALIKLIDDHSKTDGKATLTTLEYAGTFFCCGRCGNLISYPRILVHDCLTRLSWRKPDLDQYFRNLDFQPWDLEYISYAHRASERARLILHHCHLVLESVTTEALFASDLSFECTQCRADRGRLLMKWPIVIDHVTSQHRVKDPSNATDDGIIKLAKLTLAERALAHLLEHLKLSPMSQSWYHSTDWICIECKRRIPWSASLEHLKEMHPDLIPTDYTESEHERDFDLYMTLHLDAHRNSLCAPIKVNVEDPVHSFRDAFRGYPQMLFNQGPGEALERISERMAQAFSTTIGRLVSNE